MSASFNPNRTSSLSVQRQLQRTQTELLSAIARLSSGLRIQSAR